MKPFLATLLVFTLTGCAAMEAARRNTVEMLTPSEVGKAKNIKAVILEDITSVMSTEHKNAVTATPLHGMRDGTMIIDSTQRVFIIRDHHDRVLKVFRCSRMSVDCAKFTVPGAVECLSIVLNSQCRKR